MAFSVEWRRSACLRLTLSCHVPTQTHVKVDRSFDLIKPRRHIHQRHHVARVDGHLAGQHKELARREDLGLVLGFGY